MEQSISYSTIISALSAEKDNQFKQLLRQYLEHIALDDYVITLKLNEFDKVQLRLLRKS